MPGGGGGKIGDFKVTFGEDGAEELKTKMKSVGAAFDDIGKAGDKMPGALNRVFGNAAGIAGKQAGGFGGAALNSLAIGAKPAAALAGGMMGGVGDVLGGAASGFAAGGPAGAAVGAISGITEAFGKFALAGVQSSAEFERLQGIMDRMSRIAGGALAPVLDVMGDVLQQMEPPLKKFSENIGMLMGAFAEAGGRLFEALAPIMDAFLDLQTVLYDLALSALDPVIDVVVELAKIITAIVVPAVQMLTEILKDLGIEAGAHHHKSGQRDLTPKGGGIEGVQDVFKRVQMAALKVQGGKTQEQLMAEVAENTKKGAGKPDWLKELTDIMEPIGNAIKWVKDHWPWN